MTAVTDWPGRIAPAPYALLAACASAALLSSCAWRLGATHHYVGPMAFRYTDPCTAEAAVIETASLGLLGEVGGPFAISLGWVDRVAAAPAPSSRACESGSTTPHWSVLLGFPRASPGRWIVSPFYTRGEGVPRPDFVLRTLAGAQMAVGEATGARVGLVSQSLYVPADDAISVLCFDRSSPLAMRLRSWPARTRFPVRQILDANQEACDGTNE